MKKCILYDRECINCNECNICDLDPNKICDNCEKCLKLEDNDYKGVVIDEILSEKDYTLNDDEDK
ncbi:MAG: hypothetical protein E7411_03715 [Ruminococcaceae bacterium]|nr:hypothetical protein [Oscillospiraceae bacterium]